MSIRHWPDNEKPREKLIHLGATQLSDAELLAIFFRTGIRGKSAVDLAREILIQSKDLRTLLEQKFEDFCKFPGAGLSKYCQLQAALELGRRYLQANLSDKNVLENSTLTRQYCLAKLCHYPHEVFACLFLDSQYNIIKFEELFHGTIDNATIYPREVVKKALINNASAVIATHNHPSGNAEPSCADIKITQRLKRALNLVDIKLLDHIVVGHTETQSLAELGKMI